MLKHWALIAIFFCSQLSLSMAQTLPQVNFSNTSSESLKTPSPMDAKDSSAWDQAQRNRKLEELDGQKRDNETAQKDLMSKFALDMKACEGKFALTDCKLDVMSKKNAQMRELKQVEHSLKAQERAIKAIEKNEVLQQRQSASELQRKEQQAQEHEKAFEQHMLEHESALHSHQTKSAGIELTPMAQDDLGAMSKGNPNSPGKSIQEQTQAQAAYEKKLREAQEHEAAVKKKLAEKTTPAAPLVDPLQGAQRRDLP